MGVLHVYITVGMGCSYLRNLPLLASAAPPAGAWPGVLDAALQSHDSYSSIAQLLLTHCQVQAKYPSMEQPITCTYIQNNYQY